MRKESRDERLDRFNNELLSRGLSPLAKLGDVAEGEIELTGIIEIFDHSKRFYTDVKFDCRFPNGNKGHFTIRFNANGATANPAVMVVLANGKYAVVKQWRPTIGRWTYELPRGYAEKIDQASVAAKLGTLKIGDLPLGTMARELGEEVMAAAEVRSITHLGNIAENTGTSNVILSFFLVSLFVPEALIGKHLMGYDEEVAKVLLWDANRVRRELGNRLADLHSLTGLGLALNFVESLPRP